MPLAIHRSLRRPRALAVSVTVLLVSLAAMKPAQAVEPVGTMSKADFIAASVAPAQQAQRDYGVPSSVTMAQAILESGWGKSGLAARDKNFFGIKCFNGKPGPVAVSCQSWNTAECLPTCAPTTATFRVYASALDSFRDHAIFLTTNSRYRPAFAYTNNANEFLYQIWKAGYATSPTYGDDVKRVMTQYNLYQYDTASTGTAKAVSLDGDARAEIVYVDAQGALRAFRNVNGLSGVAYPEASVAIGFGFDPARTFFADVDGDGKTDIVYLDTTGTLRAFRNVNGLGGFPNTQASVVVGNGFQLGRTWFADIDGDGRAEAVTLDSAGTVRAFHNVNGLTGVTYPDAPVVIGYGFSQGHTWFGDIDGDGRQEIMAMDARGTVRAFRNVNGLASFPYTEASLVIANGFTAGRTWFADIDGDGREEIIYVDASGSVVAFRNVNGMLSYPYTAGPTVIGHGFDPTRTMFAQ